jgi:hypothetical protein
MAFITQSEVIASRSMNYLYIYLDIAFLCLLAGLLIWQKKYQALLVGLFGGLLYFAVDYGIFYAWLGTRRVEGADTALFLLWLSMSYGFTNFVWIWLWLDRDSRLLEWSLLIPLAWFSEALISQFAGQNTGTITITRGTGQYHWVMAIFLVVGYLYLIIHNLAVSKKKRYPILWILAIGVLVQFAWEAILAITGIRNQSWQTLIINSLLETNMGLPYLYLIHEALNQKIGEDFKRSSVNSCPEKTNISAESR